MAGILNIPRQFQLLRHSLGFGIHSPFAYHLITEVLHQRYGYYAYERLGSRRQRLVFRLALYFRPDAVALEGSGEYAAAVEAAMPAVTLTEPAKAGLIVADARAADMDAIATALATGANILIFNYKATPHARAIADAMTAGMTFENTRDTLLLIPDPKLPLQHILTAF